MARRATLPVIVLVLLLGPAAGPAVAGGGGAGAAACAGFTEGDEVALQDGCLDGTAHFLPEGEDLRVVNEGYQPHNYVGLDGDFGTTTLNSGEEATVENPGPGVYRVWCTLHATADGEGMTGVLVVGDGGAGAEAGAASAPASASPDSASAVGARRPTLVLAAAALLIGLTALAVAARARRAGGSAITPRGTARRRATSPPVPSA